MAMGEGKIKQGGRGREKRLLHERGGGAWLQEIGLWGAQEGGQGCPIARKKGSLKPMLGDGECVCEELYPSSFHESFEELHSQRVTISPFSFTKTPFYNKRMSFMHVALIPTLLDQFSPFMCMRRACAAGLLVYSILELF